MKEVVDMKTERLWKVFIEFLIEVAFCFGSFLLISIFLEPNIFQWVCIWFLVSVVQNVIFIKNDLKEIKENQK